MQAKSVPCRTVSVAPLRRASNHASPLETWASAWSAERGGRGGGSGSLRRERGGGLGGGRWRVWLAALWTVSIIRAFSGPEHRRRIEDRYRVCKACRRHHGQPVRLGDDETCCRNSRRA